MPSRARLPRLQPTTPIHCVVPNCCDFFTSPHPHYPKEVIGMAKCEDASYDSASAVDPVTSETTSEDVDNDREAVESDAFEREDSAAATAASNNSSGSQPGDEFEMWDYVCPQYARRFYASEWI
ncbi:unnamed protein product [Hyaloperonospora brassicae]|uniref:RxLR effector candidate protein n=1 Tax=Hyaloperonospora brassicae TaxID=162125 RepID=A0AAV0V3P8_HYABA|nr:unnamed protein product [Hyaloperonospora brassicae]